jgi:hypothetical protein
LVHPVPVPTPALSDIGWNTGAQPGANLGEVCLSTTVKTCRQQVPNPFALGSLQQLLESFNKAKAVLLASAVQAAQRIPHAMDGLPSILAHDRMTFANVTGEGETLEVCHYSRELGMFPSFFDSFKQCEVVGAELLFRRVRPVDQARFENTIAALKKGSTVVWCGHPGIGKSTEANFVLLEFLRHLADGEDSEWPTKVAHRVGGQLYLYTWNAAARRVQCDMQPGETLLDVKRFSRFWTDQMYDTDQKPPVLFLELDEDERDPLVSIPTFITAPTCDVFGLFKTICKNQQSCEFYLVRPHEPEEVLLMAKLMFEADPERLCAHLECAREWDKVAKIVSNRMGIVGPLVRWVFSSQGAFELYVEVMKAKVAEVVTSTDLACLSVFNDPSSVQYFVAPYPLESPKVMQHEFRFLSRYATLLLANSLMVPTFLKDAPATGLDEQFMEEVLSAQLLRDTNVPTKRRTAWQWHRDPGYAACISERTRTTSATRLEKRRRRHVRFKGSFYECDAQQLDGDTLYQSRTSNVGMGESRMFTAVKENGRTVAIHMFQTPTASFLDSAALSLPDRPFTVAFLNTTMAKFGLFEPHNANVSLHLICVVDKSRLNVKGLKFKANDPANDTVNGKDMTVQELRRDYPEVGNRLKTFLVRAGLHHLDGTKIMSLPLSELEIPEFADILRSETTTDLIEMAKHRKIKGASQMTRDKLIVM